jgi:predicted RNA-binding Zn-ribbon protein involved in translation (DUF1610 family)
MPRFKDTPKWKTREGYEQARAKPKPKPRPKEPAYRVNCPTCGARPGRSCTSKKSGDKLAQAHGERVVKGRHFARWKAGVAGRVFAAQERRWGGVTVSYECPICGGDHSRADHPQLASVFDFRDTP